MKKPNTKLSGGFSLVELLVVIAVIAIIAAIAIPNIENITDQAGQSANRRNAQNVASMYAAVMAAGGTTATWGAGGVTISNVVAALTSPEGVTVTNAVGEIQGPFRLDGIPDSTNFHEYLEETGTAIIYNP